jgi:hypothetical protein
VFFLAQIAKIGSGIWKSLNVLGREVGKGYHLTTDHKCRSWNDDLPLSKAQAQPGGHAEEINLATFAGGGVCDFSNLDTVSGKNRRTEDGEGGSCLGVTRVRGECHTEDDRSDGLHH